MRNLWLLLLLFSFPAWADTQAERIAQTLAAEAGGEGRQGLYAVACTIGNRARAWGLSPYQVVSQPHQYYGFTARNRVRLYATVRHDADEITALLLSGRLVDCTGGALYFRRPDEPRFRWCKIETYRWRNHVFYR